MAFRILQKGFRFRSCLWVIEAFIFVALFSCHTMSKVEKIVDNFPRINKPSLNTQTMFSIFVDLSYVSNLKA